jgi:drug/metabolite transporter (DMT)-like permease
VGILLGLMAAFGWGTGDFITRGVTRRIGALRTIIYSQLFGLLTVLALTVLFGEWARAASISAEGWLIGIVGGAVSVFATFSLFNAFERGVLMVVAPIAASYGAITVLLSLVSGETLSVARALGVVMSIVGVILASIELTSDAERVPMAARSYRLPPGIAFALLAALLFGINFWMLGFYVVPALGPILPVLVTRLLGIIVMLAIALIARQSARPPAGRALWGVIAVAVLDTMAFAANNLGMESEQIAVVAVLSSMFAAVTVLLAWIFLRERIRPGQWLGIALILAGILLVSV